MWHTRSVPTSQTHSDTRSAPLLTRHRVGLILGPALFSILFFIPEITGLESSPRAVLAVTVWVATWWVTEALPIPATSLLPIFLLPLTGGTDQQTASMAYANPIVFMYMGGFTIAIAIQRWNLHKRIAMTIMRMVGSSGHRITLGVIIACAFLSMWISNAATALMMLPIGLALIEEIKEKQLYDDASLKRFAKGLLLSIAYASSIGGLASLIGTVPNAVFAAQAELLLDVEVTFAQWLIFAGPPTWFMLFLLYLFITRVRFRVHMQKEPPRDFARDQLRSLGPMSYEEIAVFVVFVCVALTWIFAGLIPEAFRPTDPSIAMAGAVLMFLLPAKQRQGGLLVWEDMKELPWGILLLFGGGLSLAAAFESSELTPWFGEVLIQLEVLPYVVLVVALAAIVLFMTEIMSNTAVSNMLIPVSVGMALGIGIDPFSIMAVVALASTCAFMLPTATPPNAAVFSSGYLTMDDMIRSGFWLNIVALVVISLVVIVWQPLTLASGL